MLVAKNVPLSAGLIGGFGSYGRDLQAQTERERERGRGRERDVTVRRSLIYE